MTQKDIIQVIQVFLIMFEDIQKLHHFSSFELYKVVILYFFLNLATFKLIVKTIQKWSEGISLCKGVRNPEITKNLMLESGIRPFGIQNSGYEIWNLESRLQNLESTFETARPKSSLKSHNSLAMQYYRHFLTCVVKYVR